MAFKPPAIPEILTQKSWDKNKGTVAKMAGETGVGAALKKLAELHAKTDWKKLDYGVPSDGFSMTSAEAKKHFEAGKAFANKELIAVSNEFKAVRDLCEATAKKFKANKLIPAASIKHVEEMQKAADFQSVGYKPNSWWVENALKVLEQDVKNSEFREKQLAGSVEQLNKGIAEIETFLAKNLAPRRAR